MNPLDDHELLRWAIRAGLTRDEVHQAIRKGLDAGRLPVIAQQGVLSKSPVLKRNPLTTLQSMAGHRPHLVYLIPHNPQHRARSRGSVLRARRPTA